MPGPNVLQRIAAPNIQHVRLVRTVRYAQNLREARQKPTWGLFSDERDSRKDSYAHLRVDDAGGWDGVGGLTTGPTSPYKMGNKQAKARTGSSGSAA